jgi:hypothetical protein
MSKKKDKAAKAPEDAAAAISVAAHPRARASIRKIRGRTALAAFALVLFLSLNGGVTGQEAVVRALIAGVAGNLVGWACALAVWRQIVVQEVRLVAEARRERARAQAEALAAEAEAKAAAATA